MPKFYHTLNTLFERICSYNPVIKASSIQNKRPYFDPNGIASVRLYSKCANKPLPNPTANQRCENTPVTDKICDERSRQTWNNIQNAPRYKAINAIRPGTPKSRARWY